MPPVVMPAVTGVILAGGAGRRLGGIDKGWLDVAGLPLIARAVDALRPQVDELVCVANRNRDAYAQTGLKVIHDLVPGHAGPLAGVLSALAQAPGNWIALLPVDAYRPPPDLVQRLWSSLRARAAYAAIVYDGIDRIPVCGLLSKECVGALHAGWERGERSLLRALQTLNPVEVDFSDWPRDRWSINTPAEWLAACVAATET